MHVGLYVSLSSCLYGPGCVENKPLYRIRLYSPCRQHCRK